MILLYFVNFIILANILLGVVIPHSCISALPRKEGGTQVLAGLALSNQILGSLLRTPWPKFPSEIWQNVRLGKFTLMEKYTQLLLTNRIWHFHDLIK